MGLCLLDIPDEILVKIIKYFVPRERIALGKSCTRFQTLVFTDKELLRNLDFSKNGRLTSLRDIWRYFCSDENACENIITLNLRNVNCLRSGEMLINSVGKATNLFELDIQGTKFKDVEELGTFLNLLPHLKKLSVEWPVPEKEDVSLCKATLRQPFSKLIYLWVKVCVYSEEFLPTVQICDELRELRITATPPADRFVKSFKWNLELEKPKNLQVVQVSGWYSCGSLKEYLVSMLPDRYNWTDFEVIDIFRESGFYLERNVEVCEELNKTKLKETVPYLYLDCNFKVGWFLLTEALLNEVIKITHEDVPENFCCLKTTEASFNLREEPCLMHVEDAKRLLKDPWYQIPFLQFKHSIERNCDAHLVASAFPNITELVLSHVIKNADDEEKRNLTNKPLIRRLRKRGDFSGLEDQEDSQINTKSCFEMLIENTPHVKDLTIFARNICDEGFGRWDLEALYLIPNWKNLTNLRLAYVPVKDGKFLIHIGVHCPNLEILTMENLGFERPCCWTKDLCEMLKICRNLKEFLLDQAGVAESSEILDSIVDNSKLEKFKYNAMTDAYDITNIMTSVEELLKSCKNLTTFFFVISPERERESNNGQLLGLLRRLKDELNRPGFQFEVTDHKYHDNDDRVDIDRIFEDDCISFFPPIY